MNDQELLASLRHTDSKKRRQAMHFICSNYPKKLEAFLIRKIKSKQVREELIQDILAEGIVTLSNTKFQLEKSIIKYLLGIAHNLSNNHLRKQYNKANHLAVVTLPQERWEQIFNVTFDKTNEIDHQKKLNAIKRAFNNISRKESHKPQSRNCGYLLSLKYIQNLTYQEIGDHLQSASTAVKMKISRCKKAFYQLIQQELKSVDHE